MKKVHPDHWFGLPSHLVLVLLASLSFQAVPSPKCDDQDLLAVIKHDDPVYANAMELTESLQTRGYIVKCVLQSKMVHLFEGQLGAAVYRTNRGDFEALFLPKGTNFAIRPVERRENGRYLYTFNGSPRQTSSLPFDSNRPWFFSQHANVFFITDNKQLATDLSKAL